MTKLVPFSTGDVVKVFFFMTLNKFRRMFSFIGICTKKNSKTKTFTLKNYYGTEYVSFNFLINSPNIVKLDKLTSYNFKFNKSKLNNIKKFKLIGRTDLISEKPVELRKDPLHFFFIAKSVPASEKKRIRNKFRI